MQVAVSAGTTGRVRGTLVSHPLARTPCYLEPRPCFPPSPSCHRSRRHELPLPVTGCTSRLFRLHQEALPRGIASISGAIPLSFCCTHITFKSTPFFKSTPSDCRLHSKHHSRRASRAAVALPCARTPGLRMRATFLGFPQSCNAGQKSHLRQKSPRSQILCYNPWHACSPLPNTPAQQCFCQHRGSVPSMSNWHVQFSAPPLCLRLSHSQLTVTAAWTALVP